MSYNIFIGNAELNTNWDPEDSSDCFAEWVVLRHEEAQAPNKPDLTGNGNSCHPGYSQWSNAMREVGLFEVWFGEGGIIEEHPGIVPLTKHHLQKFELAQARYLAAHPFDHAGVCLCRLCRPWDRDALSAGDHDPYANFNFDRLEWMVWWARWALATCERPAISNR